jgi:hypothetical protein
MSSFGQWLRGAWGYIKPVLTRLFVAHMVSYPVMMVYAAALIIPVMLSFDSAELAKLDAVQSANKIGFASVRAAFWPYVFVHIAGIPWSFEKVPAQDPTAPKGKTKLTRWARAFWITIAVMVVIGAVLFVGLWGTFFAKPIWSMHHLKFPRH